MFESLFAENTKPNGHSFVDDATKERDGLYISRGPILSSTLLHSEGRLAGEDNDESRGIPTGEYMSLRSSLNGVTPKFSSKVTQRLLRDLACECKEGKLRDLWRRILTSKASTHHFATEQDNRYSALDFLERNPYYDPRVTEHVIADSLVLDSANNTDPAAATQPVETDPEREAQLAHFKIDDSMPNINLTDNAIGRFDIINDPLDESCTQILLPECSKMYGGSLSQWGNVDKIVGVNADNATSEFNIQKYGHTSGIIDRYSRPRSILRIRISQLCLLAHPYLNLEETLYIELKRIYAHYRAIFEHRSILYISHRLCSLVAELKLFKARAAATPDDVDEDHLATMACWYKEFVETLFLLMQVQTAMSVLSSSLYDTWKSIKQARRDQGFVCTRAALLARELQAATRNRARSALDTPEKSRASSPSHSHYEGAEDKPLLGSAKKNRKDRDDSEIDDKNRNRLNSDMNAYKEDLNLYNEFTKLLSEDIMVIFSWLQEQLAGAEKKRLEDSFVVRSDSNGEPDEERTAFVAAKVTEFEKKQSREFNEVKKVIDELKAFTQNGNSSNNKTPSFFPNAIFRLSGTASVTPDSECTVLERKRRLAISCTEFTLKLRVNGEQLSNQRCVGTVSYPSLAVNFNTSFELHVYHNPYDICLDVYMRLPTTWVGMLPSVISSSLVASVGVPISMALFC